MSDKWYTDKQRYGVILLAKNWASDPDEYAVYDYFHKHKMGHPSTDRLWIRDWANRLNAESEAVPTVTELPTLRNKVMLEHIADMRTTLDTARAATYHAIASMTFIEKQLTDLEKGLSDEL